MSHSRLPEATDVWKPPHISHSLTRYADMFHDGAKHMGIFSIEELLAQTLAKETQHHFQIQGGADEQGNARSPIYRAAKACDSDYTSGNCFAQSEAIGSIGASIGLNMRIHYNGKHASCYWYAPSQVWTIDGDLGLGYKTYPYDADLSALHILADTMSDGRMITEVKANQATGQAKHFNHRAVTGQLGEVTVPRFCKIVLPVSEGVSMLSAIGDRNRYEALGRSDRLEENNIRFAEQIPTFESLQQ